MMSNINYNELLMEELKNCYGENAQYREGQMEAIIAVLEGKRTLVVQKTGWGKSLVYFMATKLLRKKDSKMALIISPLLVLMNNQIESAAKMGLNVKTINSDTKKEWNEILQEVDEDKVDALIVSPERLANEKFKKILMNGLADKIGLFVVDEAHCISDWGHDFRPDYRRIVNLIKLLPSNVPVLATTATANDRVINDIKAQLGGDIVISRGGLIRESISVETVALDSREERLVWLKNNIPNMPGSGVVYCLTIKDCNLVERWLNSNGISSRAFYGDVKTEEKSDIVRLFMNNEIKVLVATTAFGMGFDKADIGFVVHFQRPGNLIAYYQQIGRAGRQINDAYAVMLYGEEDDVINEYFINTAFPTADMMNRIVEVVTNNPGIKKNAIEMYTDIKSKKIEQCLKYLDVNGDIYVEKSQYYKTAKPWKTDLERSQAVTAIRRKERENIEIFSKTSDCYMEFIAKELDDKNTYACGRCANCLGKSRYNSVISPEEIADAHKFIKNDFNVIKPRKRWPDISCSEINKLDIELEYRVEEGRVLSNYGDAGWGCQVADDKYRNGKFSDELVTASYELLKDFVTENEITALTYIPSLRRPNLVKDFAEKLADRLGVEFFTALEKTEDTVCQKTLNNGYNQWKNVNNSFAVTEIRTGNTLLVDDMVDSRWTFACCGYKMLKKGSGKVYPFALANSGGEDE